jgi:hypothetical protein
MKLKVDPAGSLRILGLLSHTCPEDQYVREFVKNALEALERGLPNGSKGCVSIARDKQYPNKIVIANSKPSDPFTYEIVRDNLLALGKTGHDKEVNHGIGSKVSYLPKNPAGALFRSRDMQQQWEMGVTDESICLRPFEVTDENGQTKEHLFPHCNDDEYTFENSETEIVLLGATEEEDTWLKAMRDVGCAARGQSGRGYAIWDYINRKFWTVPDNIDINVHIDDDKGTVRSARGLKAYKDKQTVNGVVELDNGMRVHFYALDQKTSHIPSGTIAILHQNEIIHDKARSDSTNRKLMHEAGVYIMHKSVMLIIEVPDALGWKQSIERGSLVKDGESFTSNLTNYLEEFREKFPESLKDWMVENTPEYDASDIEAVAKSVVGKLKSNLSTAKEKTKSTKGKSSGTGPNADGDGNGADNGPSDPKPPKPPRPPRRRKKRKPKDQMGNESGSGGDVPKFQMTESGKDAPMIEWNRTDYICSVNTTNVMFQNLLSMVCDGEPYPVKIAKLTVAEYAYLAAVKFYTIVCQTYQTKAEDILLSKLEDDNLESGAVLSIQGNPGRTRKRIEDKMRKASMNV